MDAISQTTLFKRIFGNKNVRIFIEISLKFVPKGPINNISTLVQIMAWCRPGDKPLSEPMMVSSPTHICVARPRWVQHTPEVPKVPLKYHTISCPYMCSLLRSKCLKAPRVRLRGSCLILGNIYLPTWYIVFHNDELSRFYHSFKMHLQLSLYNYSK